MVIAAEIIWLSTVAAPFPAPAPVAVKAEAAVPLVSVLLPGLMVPSTAE